MKKFIFLTLFSFSTLAALFGQVEFKSKYPDIPIVDAHAHPDSVRDVVNFLKVSEVINRKYGSHLAFWIGLNEPGDLFAEMTAAGKNRMRFCISQYRGHRGLDVTPEEIIAKVKRGYMGFKFAFPAPYRWLDDGEEGITRVDDPRYDGLFEPLEKANILLAGFHVADPNGPFGDRQNWMKDPVYFWEQIRAFENFLIKYPNFTIMAAHGVWLVCQDAQIDYLRYMFSRYPNLYVDLAATFQYFHLVNRDNLRDLFIEYQDRILFGTDFGVVSDNAMINDAITAVNNLGGGTVTVTGTHVSTTSNDHPVNIPSGVTVLWKADISSNISASYALCLSGDGVFEVTEEGIDAGTIVRIANFALSAMYVQRAILVEAGSKVTVKVCGGTVSTLHKGIAISSGANVEVSGGTVSARGNTSSAISGRANITISGNGIIDAQATAINTSGTITINGGTINGNFAVRNSLTVAQGITFTVQSGRTLTIRDGATVNNNGIIVNNGTILSDNAISGTFYGNAVSPYSSPSR